MGWYKVVLRSQRLLTPSVVVPVRPSRWPESLQSYNVKTLIAAAMAMLVLLLSLFLVVTVGVYCDKHGGSGAMRGGAGAQY